MKPFEQMLMTNLRLRTASIFTLIFLAASMSAAQTEPGQALPNLVQGNERFAVRLLRQVHSAAPQRNVAISPVSLSLMFAALQRGTHSESAHKEINAAFGWGEYPYLEIPARMLLAAFEEPGHPLRRTGPARKSARDSAGDSYVPSAAWISNVFLYSGTGTISPDFVKMGEKYFGLKFINTAAKPEAATIAASRPSARPLPQVPAESDALISSGTHLQTRWRGNTFSMSKPYRDTFQISPGKSIPAEFLRCELEVYPHAKTDDFEAAALPTDTGYMVVVLPGAGRSIGEIELELADKPEMIDTAMKREIGQVAMPTFHIRFETALRRPLEELGIKSVFHDLPGIITIDNSHIREVTQKIDLEVTRDGIRADAETVAGVVYGGIAVAPKPFDLVLDRPFIFFVRERNTNVLLFLGAVMNPHEID